MGDHPVKVPPETVRQWRDEEFPCDHVQFEAIVNRVAQWGADQELEACCEWFDAHIPGYEMVVDKLRAARRPKPPSLAEQALQTLNGAPGADHPHPVIVFNGAEAAVIRAALERLAELEVQQ